MKQINRSLVVIFSILFVFCSAILSSGKEIKIGVYKSIGAKGIESTLSKVENFKVKEINDLDKKSIFQFDVIVLGSVKGFPYKSWQDNLELYVRCGGGVLLHHDATGFRGWDKSLFPSLFKGNSKINSHDVYIADKTSEITKGIPSKFKHSYYDHIQLELRNKGKVLVKDRDGKPVVIAGKVGNGRVIGNGMVTGYAYTKVGEIEKEPEGGERELLINSIRWLAEPKLTNIPKTEVAKCRRKIESEIALRRAAEVTGSRSMAITASGSFNKDWYSDTMLNEQGYVHPPVNILKGRFFLFDGDQIGICRRGRYTGREYKEIVSILRQLKWLGVTDIIAQTGGPLKVSYLSKVPKTSFSAWARDFGFDYLEVMVKACHEVGLNVWVMWHPKERKYNMENPTYRRYYIRDAKGEVYAPYVDILSPEFNKHARKIIDELAERYNKYGNLKGIFLDEFWHPFTRDYLEDDIDKYVSFCKENYKETPPEDISKFFAMGIEWHKPQDKWWRRYILWKNTLIVNWVRKITEYANSKGLLIINQPLFTPGYSRGWFWGYGDTYRLCREGNLLWTYEARNSRLFEQYPQNKTIFGTYTHYAGGYADVCLIRGNLGSHFTFQNLWLPIGYGVNPNIINVVARQIRSNREWYGAKSLCKSAILTNGIGLELRFSNANQLYKKNNLDLQKKLSSFQDTGMLLVRNTEFYDRYKVLLAPPYSTSYLPEETIKGLKTYIQNGGTIIALNSKFSTSREDLTEEKDLTPEFLGVRYKRKKSGNIAKEIKFTDDARPELRVKTFLTKAVKIINPKVRVIATFGKTGDPAITELSIGKGRVIAFHYDVIDAISTEKNDTLDYLVFLIKKYSSPAITIKGNLKIFSTLKKGNWVVVTLLGEENKNIFDREYPAKGKLYIDMERLGLHFKKYKVLSLARDREIQPQGKHWNFWGKNYWTSKIIKEGIDIYIAPNSLVGLELPSKTKDSYAKHVTLTWWNRRKLCRSYEHEIIAIAPIGESYPGEKE